MTNTAPKAMVVTGYGLNSEEETAFAFERVGFNTVIRHINDLAENPNELYEIQALSVPGGFSYGDDTGSGNAFAQKMRLTIGDALKEFVSRDTLTLGICNGCQIVVNLGLAPACDGQYGVRQVAVTHNASARYQCRWIDLGVTSHKSPWLEGVVNMHIPVAHGEGRFMMDDATLKTLKDNDQIALRYTKDGKPANGEFPYNPNGSTDDIAGITDESGRVLVLMPHPERGMFTWQRDDFAVLKDQARRLGMPLPEEADGLALFENAARYFGVNAMKKTG
ncbi:MAG: phosphoribosylformylglycinamidine synthase subunit PurQ [Alphaproteobacteria bacterium]|nr:phosphoribosylformylglycinamidine synthase subunit PurQ [Alphaproteobacteria bacterium]NCQ88103.1 phosphoribosylformylglycinamidine synthase subunit PurQ [Alphaproteobacteria bacterium]NCT05390.1 phosphoribosylformylglycinamidine synthase subunit PurQ [Alphaproteobacteria bacterium]